MTTSIPVRPLAVPASLVALVVFAAPAFAGAPAGTPDDRGAAATSPATAGTQAGAATDDAARANAVAPAAGATEPKMATDDDMAKREAKKAMKKNKEMKGGEPKEPRPY